MASTSARAGKRPSIRQLGSLRHASIPNDTTVQIPKLNIPSRGQDERQDYLCSGIQGNAMTLPTPKQTSRSLERRQSAPSWSRASSPSKSASPTKAVSHEACEKKMKEVLARENELKNKVSQLQKQVKDLTARLAEKDGTIQNLTSDKDTMEKNYQQQLEEERTKHTVTRKDLESALTQLKETLARLQALEKESEEKMEQLRLDLSRQMAEMVAAKDKEIAEREEQLIKLKEQMTEEMRGNSWERQQRLEELGKDLVAIREECNMLRNNLKTLTQRQKTNQCDNCDQLAARAEKLAMTLKEKDVMIRDLRSVCARFESQLQQQDVLLKHWADSKGCKINLPK